MNVTAVHVVEACRHIDPGSFTLTRKGAIVVLYGRERIPSGQHSCRGRAAGGRARYVVDGQEFEARGGEILVIKAGEVHEFTVISDEPLVQVDVHMSPRFIQEN